MLEIAIKKTQKATVLSIKGDVDLYSSPQVRKAIINQTKKKAKNLLIDLTAVEYMDSSGVATLVEGLQQVGKYSGKLKLYGLNDAVKEVFELSRLDKVFEIFKDENQAAGTLE